jgi:hypothetical protein
MRLKKYRWMAAALCAAFLLCGFTTTAYAGGGEEWEDGTGGPEWEGLDPVEPAGPPATPEPEPEPEPEKSGGAGMLLAVLGVLALGGGAGWYFKIYRPKQQQAAGPGEDFDEAGEYGGDYGGEYDDLPPWDEEETEGGE